LIQLKQNTEHKTFGLDFRITLFVYLSTSTPMSPKVISPGSRSELVNKHRIWLISPKPVQVVVQKLGKILTGPPTMNFLLMF